MGDDAEYYFETMMEDPEFRRKLEELEDKRKHEERFRYLVKKHRKAVRFLSQPTTGPHNLTKNQICDQLGIHRSVYYACIESDNDSNDKLE